ncbi:MAG: FtsX-like permease family protein, partial [Hominimerdicola sp.]
NPDLAYEYSSRIVKLLDGKLIDDSDPYDGKDENKSKKSDEKKLDKKAEKKERKKLQTSMSFLTALSLSKNNLLTKKGRTFLTSFAGSIGIIGIALILSLSNGVQLYIDSVQSDTLSSYPLQITKTTANMTEIMESMAGEVENRQEHDNDKIYSQNQMSTMIEKLLEETKVNNLEDFKKFLDENEELEELTTDIQYAYSTPMNIYKADTENGVTQVNPSTLLSDMGTYSEDQLSSMSALGMGSADVWAEMIDNDELIEKQYDVIAGKLPEEYNEVVLVVDKYNEINDYVLYSLGILDSSELNGIMRKAMAGEEINLDTDQTSYTYDELMDLKFKLVLPTDYYEKSGDIWVDKSEDASYVKNIVDNGIELSIVGIVRPSEDASAQSIGGAIGYRHELTEYLVNKVSESEIVQDQLDNPDTDIFTGLKFEDTESEVTAETEETTEDTSSVAETSDSSSQAETEEKSDSSLTDEEKATMAQMGDSSLSEEEMAAMAQMNTEDLTDEQKAAMAQIQAGDQTTDFAMTTTDTSKMSDAQKEFVGSLTDEQMELMQKIFDEQAQAVANAQNGTVSTSSYDSNLETLGYAKLDNPSSINIYPKDFEAKERITEIIDEYNNSVEESDKIEYTDLVGLMMSSVTTIINAISYILIAFVAISLVVSSIMIGIITYISVLERTKEIGILRSIGASKKDISRVFNAETTIVGLVAGLLGIGISYLLTIPINAIIKSVADVPMRAQIPVAGAVILVAISVFLTVIAGLFPSRVAAKKDPVIALRTE